MARSLLSLLSLLLLTPLLPAQEYRTFSADYWWAPRSGLEDPTARALDYVRKRRALDPLLRRGPRDEARALLEELLAYNPHDGELWVHAAAAAYADRDFEEAIAHYERAIELGAGWKPVVLPYNVACSYSLLGEVDAAFAWLQRTLSERWADRAQLLSDTDLAPLREDPRWEEMVDPGTDQTLSRDERWRYDIAFLQQEARRLTVQRGQGRGIEAVVAELQAVADHIEEIPDEQVGAHLQAAIAGLGDGHSFVMPTDNLDSLAQLPITLRWFPEGLFVLDAREGHEEWIGAQVLQLGALEADALLPVLGRYNSMDNAMNGLWVGPVWLTLRPILQYLGCTASMDEVELRIRDRSGAERTRSLAFADLPVANPGPLPTPPWVEDAPRWLARTQQNFWLETLAEGPLYVQWNMVRNGTNETLAAFADRIRSTIDADDPSALILDVRHNGGGNGNLNASMLRAVAHFQNTHPDRPIFVLIARSTFSAAQAFITRLDNLCDVTFVGEPSGSRANFAGESNLFQLPYSGLFANVANRYHQNSRYHDARLWIAPDVPVYLTAEEFFAGRDAAMDTVLGLLAGR